MLLTDLAATSRLATEVVRRTRPGDLLVLTGPLGAGKTTLVAAIGHALGSSASITSPTYTLVHEYPTPAGTLVHVDAYRFADARDVERLGLDDYLDRSRLTVVEWGTGLLASRPEAHWIELDLRVEGDTGDGVGEDRRDAAGAHELVRTARWRDPREAALCDADATRGAQR